MYFDRITNMDLEAVSEYGMIGSLLVLAALFLGLCEYSCCISCYYLLKFLYVISKAY